MSTPVDLYSMPEDFSLWYRTELFSPEQQDKILHLKVKVWDATVAACPQASFRPACSQALPALTSAFEVARLRVGASQKHPPQVVYAMLFGWRRHAGVRLRDRKSTRLNSSHT